LASGSKPQVQTVDVSSKLEVAQLCVCDLSAEVQPQGKPVAEVLVTNMKAGH
jgi:hypothetical protein